MADKSTAILTSIDKNSDKFIKNFTNPKTLFIKNIGKLISFLKSFIKNIFKKETTYIKGYILVGNNYISKKLLAKICLGFTIAISASFILYTTQLKPLLSNYFTPSFFYNSNKLEKYSGKAKIYVSNKEQIVYKGMLKAGKCSGSGVLYDLEGKLIYKGDFEDNKFNGIGEFYKYPYTYYNGGFKDNLFEGTGKLSKSNIPVMLSENLKKGFYINTNTFFENGKTINSVITEEDSTSGKSSIMVTLSYEGDFKTNLYDGYGSIIFNCEPNKYKYAGNFVNGLFDGTGTYYENDKVVYTGSFKSGHYFGTGKLYNPETGSVIYEGEFNDGIYNGLGKLYYTEVNNSYVDSTIKLAYEGGFIAGKFSGKGIIYDVDKKERIYEGEFHNGMFNGLGKLNYYEKDNSIDSKTIKLTYEGQFMDNKFTGTGKLYNAEEDILLYEGAFSNNLFNGAGKQYDSVTSSVIYEGVFKNNQYNGNGKLYNTKNNRLVFEGEFIDGQYCGEGTIYNKTGKKLFSGPLMNNDIDYAFLLGMPTSDIKNYLIPEPTTTSSENFIFLTYEEQGLSLVIGNTPENESLIDNNTFIVEKIILWKNPNLKIIKGKTKPSEISKDLGNPFYSGYTLLEDEDFIAFDNLIKFNQALFGSDQYPEDIYLTNFKLEEYTLSVASLDKDSEYLYLILSQDCF